MLHYAQRLILHYTHNWDGEMTFGFDFSSDHTHTISLFLSLLLDFNLIS